MATSIATTRASATAPPLQFSRHLRSRSALRFREGIIKALLIMCGVFSLGTTITIIAVLLIEAVTFFQMDGVSLVEFFTTSQWNPLLARKNTSASGR